MKKETLPVHEFDTIIGNIDYMDSERYTYIEKKNFDELLKFIKEFNSQETKSDASDFLKIGYRKGVNDTVSINNYVGLIELPTGFQIEILPKVDFRSETDDERSKKVFLKMLQALKEFEGKSFTNASLKADTMNLYEIFINMYIKETQNLVKHGLKSSYNMVEDNLTFYKGKLNVGNHIKNNLCHKERFFIEYDEYSLNRAENRLIKSTLLKLMRNTSSDENSREIRKLLLYFEQIEESFNYEQDFSRVSHNRNTKDYEQLMTWSNIFLKGKSFTTFSGSTNSKALLFPMEKIYEQYVAKWVKKVFGESDWSVSIQDERCYLFDEPKRFQLCPDIVVNKNGYTVIMDTKWKKLYPDVTNYGISQSDMYQMYAYSQKYSVSSKAKPEVWLLYPYSEFSDSIGKIEYCSNDGVRVHIKFIDVDYEKIEECVHCLLDEIEDIIQKNNS